MGIDHDLSKEEIEDELDILSIRALELSQDLIHQKLNFEKLSQDGYANMAKARYSMGSTSAVSSLQFPKTDFDASFKVYKSEKKSPENNVEISYFTDTLPSTESSGLKQRNNKEDIVEIPTNKKNSPIKWYGVLVPKTLRDAQKRFVSCNEMVMEIANIQCEINAIIQRQKSLAKLTNDKSF